MVLLFDVGNSSIYIGLANQSEIIGTYRINVDLTKTPDEYFISIKTLIDHKEIKAIAIKDNFFIFFMFLKCFKIKYFTKVYKINYSKVLS